MVAIPSNRVNVSYRRTVSLSWATLPSRNPLKSGQCFLRKPQVFNPRKGKWQRRNPLKSGQCFLLNSIIDYAKELQSRNPLKSGQCFLPRPATRPGRWAYHRHVAIPSNRVNVSYLKESKMSMYIRVDEGRNPLKSGQCFLLGIPLGSG